MSGAARIALAATLALPPAFAVAGSPMLPGMWESTTTIARAGQVPVVSTERDCVTQQDIDSGTKSMPRPPGNCNLANVVTQDAKTSYDFACTDGNRTLTGSAQLTIEPTRYDGKLSVTTRTGSGPDVASTMVWSARRVGDCR